MRPLLYLEIKTQRRKADLDNKKPDQVELRQLLLETDT
jgi:hypothetical protein